MPGRSPRQEPPGQDRPTGDELYEVPPGDFVAARTALVRELRAGGERDVAAEVAAWRRPTRSAWALNQVARQQPELIESYLGAVANLRQATDRALEGDISALRSAQADERAALDSMVVAASQRLEASGEVATPILVQRMTDSLAAARTDDEAAAAIRAGRLVEDLTPATLGLDSFGFRSAAERDSKATGSKQAERARSARERAARETADLATQLRAEADEARAEADRVELAAKEASKAADEAERRAEAAQRKAEQARAKVDAKR